MNTMNPENFLKYFDRFMNVLTPLKTNELYNRNSNASLNSIYSNSPFVSNNFNYRYTPPLFGQNFAALPKPVEKEAPNLQLKLENIRKLKDEAKELYPELAEQYGLMEKNLVEEISVAKPQKKDGLSSLAEHYKDVPGGDR